MLPTAFLLGLGLVSLAPHQAATEAQTASQPIPVLRCADFSAPFEEAYLTNGFIGIRPGPDPLAPAMTMVSGYVMDCAWEPFENAAEAPYPFLAAIEINGEAARFSGEAGQIIAQTLDMNTGELTTELKAVVGGVDADIEIVQFIPRTLPAAACMRATISVSSDAEIQLCSLVEQGLQEARNKLGIAVATSPDQPVPCPAGETVSFDLIAGMVSSLYHPDPQLQAKRVVGWGKMKGLEGLRDANQKAWADLWEGRIRVFGSPEGQRALDAAFFYVMASASPYSITGIAPYAYSHVHPYFGHGFWDMDHWVYHAVLPLQPRAARAMMEYRFRNIDMARKKAMTFGFDGLMFAWEASVLDGSETTPSTAETGWAEHHVVPGVGLAFWEYYLATGDPDFLEDQAWPVLEGVAQWILSRGDFTERGFEIRNVMGVDEHVNNIDNNTHMNLLCKMALSAALRTAELTGHVAPETWRRAADRMRIPIDQEEGVILPYDGVEVHENARGYSIGSVQFLVFHDPPVDRALFERTWDYEESLRAVMAPASNNPASSGAAGFPAPTIATCAALFGEPQKAADIFRISWENYTLHPYLLSKERQGHSDGNFITNQGAQLQAAIYGFTGLRLAEGSWVKEPARLPAGWERIEIGRIYVRGKPMRLVARDGEPAELTPLEE